MVHSPLTELGLSGGPIGGPLVSCQRAILGGPIGGPLVSSQRAILGGPVGGPYRYQLICLEIAVQ